MSLCESPLLIICVLQLPQRLIRVSSVCTQSTLIYVFSSSTLVMLSSHSSKIIWRKSPLSTVNSVKIYEAQITWKSLSNQAAFCSSLSQICVKKIKIGVGKFEIPIHTDSYWIQGSRFFIIRHIHNHTSIISSEMQVELKKNTAFTWGKVISLSNGKCYCTFGQSLLC